MVSDPTIPPTELEIHRAAAWWGGEGSVAAKNRRLSVSFAQKERAVCEWFLARFGGSVYTRPATMTRNEISNWVVCGKRAKAFMALIVDLIPESPRRQAQLRAAIAGTIGELRRGPKPQPFCALGHPKEAGRCKQCGDAWRKKNRAKPEVMERHRLRERNRRHQQRIAA